MKPLEQMTVAEVLRDSCASDWLKSALRAAVNRDPIDAANDAESLAQILRGRAGRVLRGETE